MKMLMKLLMNHLLEPYEESPREHGVRFIKWGLVSLGAWLTTVMLIVLILSLILPPPSPPMRDIGPAMSGPPVNLNEAKERGGLGVEKRLIVTVVSILVVAFVFWGGYSVLMVTAGLFERFSDIPFHSLNDWFYDLVWFKKIVIFPFLLAAMILVIWSPFLVLGAAAAIFDLLS